MNTIADRMFSGIQQAKNISNYYVYNVDTNQTVTLTDAAIYCARNQGCIINYELRLVGDKQVIDDNMEDLLSRQELRGALGPFQLLNAEALRAVASRMTMEDIVKLCATSATFRQKCIDANIYESLTRKFFPDSPVLSSNPATNFSNLWSTRITIDEFHAATTRGFQYHRKDAREVFDAAADMIDIMNEDGRGATLASKHYAVDAVFISQFPRHEIYESLGREQLFIDLMVWADNAEKFEEKLGEFILAGMEFKVPHIEAGIPHQTYLDLLQDIAPDSNLYREQWVSQMNANIAERLAFLASEDENDPDLEDLAILLSLTDQDPYLFWTYNPNVGDHIENIRDNWTELMDFLATDLDDEEVFNRFVKMSEGKPGHWYAIDIDEFISDSDVRKLTNDNMLDDEDLVYDRKVITDQERWEIWLGRFAVYMDE